MPCLNFYLKWRGSNLLTTMLKKTILVGILNIKKILSIWEYVKIRENSSICFCVSLSFFHVFLSSCLYATVFISSMFSFCSHMCIKQDFSEQYIQLPWTLIWISIILINYHTLRFTLRSLYIVQPTCTDKKENKFSSYTVKGNSDGIWCKVIYEEGLPNIWGNAQIFSPYMRRS